MEGVVKGAVEGTVRESERKMEGTFLCYAEVFHVCVCVPCKSADIIISGSCNDFTCMEY